MDALTVLIVIILLAIIFVVVKRSFSGIIYAFAITDIFLRLMSFVKHNISATDIKNIIGKYLPENVPAIIGKYTNGILEQILLWIYFAIMVVFLFYVVRTFIRKR